MAIGTRINLGEEITEIVLETLLNPLPPDSVKSDRKIHIMVVTISVTPSRYSCLSSQHTAMKRPFANFYP